MQKRINALSVISTIISTISVGMFGLLLWRNMKFLYALWLMFGVISIIFPIIAKYFRIINGEKGKGFEIVAIILGFCNLYWVLSAITKWHIAIIMAVCGLVCVLYAVLFGDLQTKKKTEIPTKNTYILVAVLVSAFAAFCALFLCVDSLVWGELEGGLAGWLPTFFGYCIPPMLFLLNRKKMKPILAILCFCVVILLSIWALGILLEESPFDFSIEAVVTFLLLLLSTFVSLVLSVVAMIKAKWDFSAYYNSIGYREKCYKRVEKMKRYLDSGVISQEEFEKAKREIIKHIPQ